VPSSLVYLLREGATVTTESQGSGRGGSLNITADTLQLDNATISAQTAASDVGNASLSVGRLLYLRNSTVTTVAGGGESNGGNIAIISPGFLVLSSGRIITDTRPGTGFGGNLILNVIDKKHIVVSPDSIIRSSGGPNIVDQLRTETPAAGLLSVSFLNAPELLTIPCAARGGRHANSFKAGGRGGLPLDPGTPQMATPSGQPLVQQTATGSPTTSTVRPPQAAKPVMVAGAPQPVLGSPRLTCRG
jgi:hypothetical protein